MVPDRGLLAEVAGLVEWPVPLLGRIDEAFMDLPPEVMRTTMRVNQRYFALRRADGRAAPRFALVANIIPADGGAGDRRRQRAGAARPAGRCPLLLGPGPQADGWRAFLPKLEAVVFHAKLGTQGERVRRLERLAGLIAPQVGCRHQAGGPRRRCWPRPISPPAWSANSPRSRASWAATTRWPTARTRGWPRRSAAHYRPLGPGDAVPAEPVAVAVALADKLDQLVGFFAVGEKPTGSGDPYALRRAALGVIRIIREGGLRLGLAGLIGEAFFGFAQATGRDRQPRNSAWRSPPRR